MSNPRTRALLLVVAVLAGLRFVLVPWLDAQGQKREEVQVLTQRLDRSESLLANKALIKESDKSLGARLSAVRARFPIHSSAETFRLDMQPRIGEIASLNGMTINVFTWVLDGEVEKSELRFVRARVQLTGSMRALADFQGQLEGDLPNLLVREVAVAATSAGAMPGDALGTLTLTADLYFRASAMPSPRKG